MNIVGLIQDLMGSFIFHLTYYLLLIRSGSILGSIVPYATPQMQNIQFLAHIEFRIRISIKDVLSLLSKWSYTINGAR